MGQGVLNEGRMMRDYYWDFVKGLAIIGVVSIHFLGNESGDVWTSSIRQFVSMSVFVFIFMAGYFTNPEACVNGGIAEYYRHRCWRLALPYSVWTVACALVFHPSDFCSPLRFLFWDIILGYGIGIGYYVIALLQLTLLSPLFVAGVKRSPKMMVVGAAVVSFVMAVLASAAASGWIGSLGLSVPVPFPGIFSATWFFPFILGLALRINATRWSDGLVKYRGWILVMAAMAFVLQVIEVRWLRLCGVYVDPQFGIVGMLCAAAWCLVAVAYYRCGLGTSPLAVLGRGSYLIYMTHLVGFGILFKFSPAWCGFGMKVKMLPNYLAGIVLICGLYTAGIWVVEKLPGGRWKRWLAIR